MRRKPEILWGGLMGGVTSLGAIGLFSLGKVLAGMPFLPFDIFDWMARHLPGALIGFVISSMVSIITALKLGPTASTAKLAEQSIAIVQFIATGVIFGIVLTAVARRRPALSLAAGLAGALVLLVSGVFFEAELGWPSAGAAGTILWLALILGGWGWALGRVVSDRQASPEEIIPPELATSRRLFLRWLVGGSVGAAALALGEALSARERTLPVTGGAPAVPQPAPTEVAITNGAAASPPEAVLEKRFQPAAGTRPELTANADFYRIDINTLVPTINLADWKLELDGLVNQPLSLTLDEIRKLPSVSQALTMECISNE
ncbi:MAG TPA: molybdopterin-dependent oxidoreductase, partial [Anaerolineaceae bacterium]